MTPYKDYRVREYLGKIEWPKSLRIEYQYRPDGLYIVVYQNNFKWLKPETVVEVSALIPKVVFHVRSLGHQCYFEVQE